MENQEKKACRLAAQESALMIRKKLEIPDYEPTLVGVGLGTGWNESLVLEDEKGVPFSEVSPRFASLSAIPGHELKVVSGFMRADDQRMVRVVGLRGRVHMNAVPWNDKETVLQVRLQTEMLFELGVRRLITTCAAGGVTDDVGKNDIVMIDGFFDCLNRLPLFGDEFVTTDTTIDADNTKRWAEQAKAAFETSGRKIHVGGHAVVPGPHVESVRYGKPFFKLIPGVLSIGMGSVVADAAIACLYKELGVKVLPVSFITDGNDEVCTHEGNVAVAQKAALDLGKFLRAGILVAFNSL